MMPTSDRSHDERRAMTFRMPTAVIEQVDRAAAHLHQDRTAFLVEAAAAQAREVLLDQVLFPLAPADHDAFLAALDRPPEPNARLKALLRKRPIWQD